MKKLIKLLDNEILKTSEASDKNAAVSEALKNIRNSFKLDLRDVIRFEGLNEIEFIYKVEGTPETVYITATANQTPRTWKQLSYLIL